MVSSRLRLRPPTPGVNPCLQVDSPNGRRSSCRAPAAVAQRRPQLPSSPPRKTRDMPAAPTRLAINRPDTHGRRARCGWLRHRQHHGTHSDDFLFAPTTTASPIPSPAQPGPRLPRSRGATCGVGLAGGAVVGESILLGSRWTTTFERAATSAVAPRDPPSRRQQDRPGSRRQGRHADLRRQHPAPSRSR